MRSHATEHVLEPERTLCGRRLPVRVDNAWPNCRTCIRVIRSRCSRHNLKRCRLCGPDGGIVVDEHPE